MRTWIVLLLSILTASSQEKDFLLLKHKSGSASAAAAFHRRNGAPAHYLNHIGWCIVSAPRSRVDNYRGSGLFERVETNRVYHACLIPNDPLYAQLWGMQKIQSDQAWDTSTSNNVVVAVIDTGVDYDHPDLAGNLWEGPVGEHGYTAQFGNIAAGGKDDHFHGTHVAGILGGVGNNGLGVVGINWQTKIISLKFLAADGFGYTMDAILCFDKMIELKMAGHNIRVCNNSWGGGDYDPALEDAFRAAENAGILSACAAGNDFQNSDIKPFYPSSFDVNGIVSVVASDEDDNKPAFSNYGSLTTDLMAPGVGILSLDTNGGYRLLNGTSMAAPHVAGVAATIFGLNPALTVAQAKNVLLNPDSFDQTGFIHTSTFGGRLNAGKALSNVYAPPNNHPPTIAVHGSPLILGPGQSATLSATGIDPDGDALRYTVFLRVTSDTLGQSIPPVFAATNYITVTNSASAIALGFEARFGVSDGRGGTASGTGTIFMEANPALVREVSAVLSLQPVQADPFWQLFVASNVSSNDASYALHFASYFYPEGKNCCYPANTGVPLYRGLQYGPNIFRAQLTDLYGNFANSQRLLVDNGNTGIYAPEVRVTANRTRGNSPLMVTADMSESDPGGAHGLWYFSRYWNSSQPFADVHNPVQTFSLTNIGVNAVEFVAHDPATQLADKYVQLFTVLPRTNSLMSIVRLGDTVLIDWDIASPTDVLERSANLINWQPYRTGLPPVSVPIVGAEYFRVRK